MLTSLYSTHIEHSRAEQTGLFISDLGSLRHDLIYLSSLADPTTHLSNRNMDMLSQAARQRDSFSPDNSLGDDAASTAQLTGRKSNLMNQLNALATDFAQRKDHHFAVQLRQLQEDLSRLHDSSHPGYLAEVADLKDIRDESLYTAREEGDARLRTAREDYERELEAADRDFEQSRQLLKGELIGYLQGKKRRLETDRSMLDIASSLSMPQVHPHATRNSATATAAATSVVSSNHTNVIAQNTGTLHTTAVGGGATTGNSVASVPNSSHAAHLSAAAASSTTSERRTGAATPLHGVDDDPRKLRQRASAVAGGDKYPSLARTEPSTQLDEMLTHLGEQIRQRKGYSGAGAEDRARDRIEREREKLVRTMLDGARNNEIEEDLQILRRKAVKKPKRR